MINIYVSAQWVILWLNHYLCVLSLTNAGNGIVHLKKFDSWLLITWLPKSTGNQLLWYRQCAKISVSTVKWLLGFALSMSRGKKCHVMVQCSYGRLNSLAPKDVAMGILNTLAIYAKHFISNDPQTIATVPYRWQTIILATWRDQGWMS